MCSDLASAEACEITQDFNQVQQRGGWRKKAWPSSEARATRRIPLPPAYRAAYERDVAATRAQLDEATITAAWAAGRAMTPEQAIAYALRVPLVA